MRTFGIFLLLVSILGPAAIGGEELTDVVYLHITGKELLAFSAVANQWVVLNLRSGEKVLDSEHNGHVAVATTNLRVLGFSALTNQWAEERLMVGESIVTVEAAGQVGIAITDLRAFGFSAQSGRWTEKRFDLK